MAPIGNWPWSSAEPGAGHGAAPNEGREKQGKAAAGQPDIAVRFGGRQHLKVKPQAPGADELQEGAPWHATTHIQHAGVGRIDCGESMHPAGRSCRCAGVESSADGLEGQAARKWAASSPMAGGWRDSRAARGIEVGTKRTGARGRVRNVTRPSSRVNGKHHAPAWR